MWACNHAGEAKQCGTCKHNPDNQEKPELNPILRPLLRGDECGSAEAIPTTGGGNEQRI